MGITLAQANNMSPEELDAAIKQEEAAVAAQAKAAREREASELSKIEASPESSIGQELKIEGKRFMQGVEGLTTTLRDPSLESVIESTKILGPLGMPARILGATANVAFGEGGSFSESLRKQRQGGEVNFEGGLGVGNLIVGGGAKQFSKAVLPSFLEEGIIGEGLAMGAEFFMDPGGLVKKGLTPALKGAAKLIKKPFVRGSLSTIDNAFEKFNNTLFKGQKKKVLTGELSTGPSEELRMTLGDLPGSQEVLQGQKVASRGEFKNLSDVVEKEVTGNLNTLNKSAQDFSVKLNDLIETKGKAQKVRLDDLTKEVNDLKTKPSDEVVDLLDPNVKPVVPSQAITNADIGDKLLEHAQKNGIVSRQPSIGPDGKFIKEPWTTDSPISEAAHDAFFENLNKTKGKGLLDFNTLRRQRGRVRMKKNSLIKQGADVDAKDFIDLEKVYTNFMEEAAERAGKLKEFKALDIDYAVFKNDIKGLSKVLEANDETVLNQALKEIKFDTGNFLRIVDQDPEIINDLRSIVFKSALKKGRRGVEQDLNFNAVSNFIKAFPDGVGETIIGQENLDVIQRWLEAGSRSGVFKDIDIPMTSFFRRLGRPFAKDIAKSGLPEGAIPKSSVKDVLRNQVTLDGLSPASIAGRTISVGARGVGDQDQRQSANKILQLGN